LNPLSFRALRTSVGVTTCDGCKYSALLLSVRERPDSDVDLLIEFIPGEAPGGFGLVDMQDELSATFNGRKIDLAFRSVLANPYRRRTIEPQLPIPASMNSDRQAAHLADMLAFVRELRALADGLSAEDFAANRILCLATEKLFINLGEAAYRLGDECAKPRPVSLGGKSSGSETFWPTVTNRLPTKVLFNTVIHDLPLVESTLRQLVKPNPGN